MKSVLILDDDTDITEVLAAILESHGYEVVKVNRGVDGIQFVMERDFDVILCDMVMPGLPGDMFYKAVGRVKQHLCERFIFITGHSGNSNVATFLHHIQRPVLYKPIGMDDLLETLIRFLSPPKIQAA